jgi:hypothetical protein
MREKIAVLVLLICSLLAGCSSEPYDPDRADCIWYSSLDDLLYESTGKHFFLTAVQVAERKVMLDPCSQYASSMRQWRTYEEK